MLRPRLVDAWRGGCRRLSTRASHATCMLHLSPQGLAIWRADKPSLAAHMQAAGMIAAKRADEWVPMRMPRMLTSVAIWVDEGHESAPPPSYEAHAPRTQPEARTASHDGGFSANDLLDPDAWVSGLEVESESSTPAVLPASTPPTSQGCLHVHCRTLSTSATATEAMTGCVAASLALLDRLHETCDERMVVGSVCLRD